MDNTKTITLSGFVFDPQVKKPVSNVPVALAEGPDPSVAVDKEVVNTDANGAWSFEVAPGDYVVRMPQTNATLPEPGQEQGEWVFCGQFFPGLSNDKTNVMLEATFYPATERTPERDASYISAIFLSMQKEFESQIPKDPSFKDVEKAAASTMKAMKELMKPFLKNPVNIEENVPCSTCSTRCYGSTDQYCLYKCMNLPTKCY